MEFTDDQLKSISKDVLEIPDKVAALNKQKEGADALKVDMGKKDDSNKAFYDSFKGILKAYFDEIKALNGKTYTEYPDSALDDGGKLAAGNLHHPEGWPNLKPKIAPSNTGLPIMTQANHESNQRTVVVDRVAKLKTGYADGNITDELFAPFTPTSIDLKVGGFVPGQFLVIDQAGSCAYVRVISVQTVPAGPPVTPPATPPPTAGQRLEIVTLAAPTGSLGEMARVRNFHPGFSNLERTNQVVPAEPELLAYFKSNLDAETTTWKGFLTSEKTAAEANTAGGDEKTRINTAKDQIQAALDKITTWEGQAANEKYGDVKLADFEVALTDRATQIPARVTEIETALGTVTQTPDGEFSGNGNFHSLFKWVDIRISKAGGTLFQFYNFGLVSKFLGSSAGMETGKAGEFANVMIAKKIIEEPIGNFVKVKDNVGLSAGNEVKILDDSSLSPLTATIQSISGQLVELNASAVAFSVEKNVRLVKML